MILYKSKYDIPVINWLLIHEEGFNLSYLKKRNLRISKKKLYKRYIKILEQLTSVDFGVFRQFLIWQSELLKFRAENLRTKINKNYSYSSNIERAFRDYLNVLQENYNQFEITEYYFDPDYKRVYKEISGADAPKELDVFRSIRFYDFLEYHDFAKNHKEIELLTVIPQFNKIFIKSRIIKIDDLTQLDDLLLNIYIKYKKYNNYQDVRVKLFNLETLKSEIKEKRSGLEEVSAVSNILGFQIDTKKTTLAEYESLKETAKKISEQKTIKNA